MSGKKFIDYRDVSEVLKKIREILIGRKHNLHGRFMPFLSPRTIPAPDIPRCPDYKYSNQYYHERSVYHSVHPPVVAPIAEGPPLIRDPTKKALAGGIKADSICFNYPPTPGNAWWWDGHFYYETTTEKPARADTPQKPEPPCPRPGKI